MPRDSVQGLADAHSLLADLPSAADDQLWVELVMIGRDALALQQAAVPKDTGELEQALSIQTLVDKLRVKIGLLKGAMAAYSFNGRRRKAKTGGPFYGRIVEFGRRAQTVLVTRRLKVIRRLGNNRQGNNRRSVYAGKPYTMRVSALPPRDFIFLGQQVDDLAAQRLADFWGRTLDRAGASA